jgi:hypothetical protein
MASVCHRAPVVGANMHIHIFINIHILYLWVRQCDCTRSVPKIMVDFQMIRLLERNTDRHMKQMELSIVGVRMGGQAVVRLRGRQYLRHTI